MAKKNLDFVIYNTKYGQEIVRKYIVPNDPKTTKQLTHRMKLSVANRGIPPLKDVIRRGFKGTHNAYRKVVQNAINNAIEGEYPNLYLNYSKIQVADGKLQPLFGLKMKFDERTGKVIFTWDLQTEEQSKWCSKGDRINIACLNESYKESHNDSINDPILNAVYVNNASKRSEGNAEIDLKKFFDNKGVYEISGKLHFWVYLESLETGEVSGSVYAMWSCLKS